jgi:hypothetical protein
MVVLVFTMSADVSANVAADVENVDIVASVKANPTVDAESPAVAARDELLISD